MPILSDIEGENLAKLFRKVILHAKRNLIRIARSIDTGQPAQTMQADHGQNCSLLADFLFIKS